MCRKLEKRLEMLMISRIDYLILTHTHFDHAANASTIREKYKAKVIVHKNEGSCLTSGNSLMLDGTNIFTRTMVWLIAKRVSSLLRCKPCQYDLLVDSSLDLMESGFNAYIIHTPGHSAGSMSIVVDDELAIVGDAMFGVFPWSVFPPFANDVKQLINSWGKLLETSCILFLPSHGSGNTRLMVKKDYDKRKNI